MVQNGGIDLEFTSFHGHTESIATYRTSSSSENLKAGCMTATHQKEQNHIEASWRGQSNLFINPSPSLTSHTWEEIQNPEFLHESKVFKSHVGYPCFLDILERGAPPTLKHLTLKRPTDYRDLRNHS